jgi:hypothetical protein
MNEITEWVVRMLRSGHTIIEIEEALLTELETVKKVKPLLIAQKEANHAP